MYATRALVEEKIREELADRSLLETIGICHDCEETTVVLAPGENASNLLPPEVIDRLSMVCHPCALFRAGYAIGYLNGTATLRQALNN